MNEVKKEILKPRTIIAFLFYFTFCYLIFRGLEIPQELNSIVSVLMGYYFGAKGKNKPLESEQNK